MLDAGYETSSPDDAALLRQLQLTRSHLKRQHCIADLEGFFVRLRGGARALDDLARMNELTREEYGDPETDTRISQYEMAYRMQTSVPELSDHSDESQSTLDRYGPDVLKPGSFARNCLLARRLAERDVRFIQLFHRGWDQHTRLPSGISNQARDVDQPQAALVQASTHPAHKAGHPASRREGGLAAERP